MEGKTSFSPLSQYKKVNLKSLEIQETHTSRTIADSETEDWLLDVEFWAFNKEKNEFEPTAEMITEIEFQKRSGSAPRRKKESHSFQDSPSHSPVQHEQGRMETFGKKSKYGLFFYADFPSFEDFQVFRKHGRVLEHLKEPILFQIDMLSKVKAYIVLKSVKRIDMGPIERKLFPNASQDILIMIKTKEPQFHSLASNQREIPTILEEDAFQAVETQVTEGETPENNYERNFIPQTDLSSGLVKAQIPNISDEIQEVLIAEDHKDDKMKPTADPSHIKETQLQDHSVSDGEMQRSEKTKTTSSSTINSSLQRAIDQHIHDLDSESSVNHPKYKLIQDLSERKHKDSKRSQSSDTKKNSPADQADTPPAEQVDHSPPQSEQAKPIKRHSPTNDDAKKPSPKRQKRHPVDPEQQVGEQCKAEDDMGINYKQNPRIEEENLQTKEQNDNNDENPLLKSIKKFLGFQE